MKLLITGILGLASIAAGATLTAHVNVDNQFDMYVSTSDSVLGTWVGSGNDWTTTYTFTPSLTDGVTNFIHIVAVDTGPPGAFLGDFSLNDPLYQFVNGTQFLATNTSWDFNLTGFGDPYAAPFDAGLNGVAPWGTRPAVDGSAHWIWNPEATTTVYFSTPITYTGDANGAAPEPASVSLFLGGLALCWMGRRKRAA